MIGPLPWQQEHWNQVTGAADAGRLGHALLLAGPRGVGKGHFAGALAAYLLCEAGPGVTRPCGNCRGCVQVSAGTHPNVFRLSPAEDKREIAIEDIRRLIEGLQLSSHYGRAKVAIIEPADAMNRNGINALLKTLEEPSRATHLLLVSERWRALPATLRSRCQILRFAPPAPEAALEWLRARHPDAQPAALGPWLRAPLHAGTGLSADSQAEREAWERALLDLARGKPAGLAAAQGVKREQAQARLEWMLQMGVDWMASGLGSPERPGAALPAGASADAVRLLLDDAIEGLRQLERNVNPQMILESIMIRWSRRVAARA